MCKYEIDLSRNNKVKVNVNDIGSHQASAVYHQASTVYHQASAVYHQASAVYHQASAVLLWYNFAKPFTPNLNFRKLLKIVLNTMPPIKLARLYICSYFILIVLKRCFLYSNWNQNQLFLSSLDPK